MPNRTGQFNGNSSRIFVKHYLLQFQELVMGVGKSTMVAVMAPNASLRVQYYLLVQWAVASEAYTMASFLY